MTYVLVGCVVFLVVGGFLLLAANHAVRWWIAIGMDDGVKNAHPERVNQILPPLAGASSNSVELLKALLRAILGR